MIDAENVIYTRIATALRAAYPTIFVTGEIVAAPPSFPAAGIVEMDNSTLAKSQTIEAKENHATLMYQVDVYSNKTSGKKTECKSIITVIDDGFAKMGFTRTFLNPTPNLEDASIYRMTGRYRGIIGQDGRVYRRFRK